MTDYRRQFVFFLWHALPGLIVIGMMLPLTLPGGLGGLTQVAPPLPLLALYYACLEHPRRINYRFTFCLALLNDVFMALPLGLSPLMWMAARYALIRLRAGVREQGFLVAWALLAVLLAAALFLQWAALSVYHRHAYAVLPILMQWSLGVLLYPALHHFFHALERSFHRRWWFMLKAT